ncbi:probable DUR3-Urea permease [Phialocephala subalpina]|uniref:Probable DUR3-Urea permease n=1 Tax=Phialocephala subalpina TaxID=576137 RepID=A0A1L7X340_9HELO|nr:probable DUR3-Urea permease [Phialocephala subalpina]
MICERSVDICSSIEKFRNSVAMSFPSSWTWAATLLQSTSIAYDYGVSGPFWYASGATVQIILFASIAIELKRRAPNAHTFLEVIKARYGKGTHIIFTIFGLMTNILVTAMLLTGGSAAFTALTGVPTPAACFLLPLGVIIYTMFGGIKATFLMDYVHTVMLLIIIIIFCLTTYATSNILGSPKAVFDLLQQASASHPVSGNASGNFGIVFCDNGYYNKAIAASPVDALPGYILGGLSWFAIPFTCATTMGLAALVLESNPVFPTFPDRMSASDVSAGLVLPYAAVALLGSGGAVCALLIIFMAVTSATSSELIAVSSIFTYDIYQGYFNPDASGRRLIYMSHCCVLGFGLIMAAFSTSLHFGGVSMGFLYLFMGVIISSAVLPACLTLLWSGLNKQAAMLSPPLGLCCSLVAWLVTCYKESGVLTVDTLGANYPMLAGNVVALLSPCIFIPVLTLIFGLDHYDWESMRQIRKGDDHDLADAAGVDLELVPGEVNQSEAEYQSEQTKLLRASKIAKYLCLFLTLALLILWPFPMFGSRYIFSEKFFTGWVVVGIIWIFVALACVGIYPLWEGRKSMGHVFKAIYLDVTGRKHPRSYYAHGAGTVEGIEGICEGAGTPTNFKGEAKVGEKSKEEYSSS